MSEHNDITFAVSNICTAFDPKTIGSKVDLMSAFFRMLEDAIQKHDVSKDRAPGQHYIVMSDEAKQTVSVGDGLRTDNVEDYVIRYHREGPKMFLKRECAGETKDLAVVVYTAEAYIKDPDYDGEEDIGNATHVIVAVLASSGPRSPVTPYRFVHNLAGGNNAYHRPDKLTEPPAMVCALDNHISCLELEAKEVIRYWSQYAVVAD